MIHGLEWWDLVILRFWETTHWNPPGTPLAENNIFFHGKKTTQKTRRIKDYFPWCLDVFLYPHVQVFLVIFAFYQRKKTLLIFEANTDLPRRLRVLALLEFFGHIIDGNIMGIVGYNMFEW